MIFMMGDVVGVNVGDVQVLWREKGFARFKEE